MFRKITLFGVVLALIVIIAGSYVRLSGAGLGCPDWPGCYGQAIPSGSADFVEQAARTFPGHIPDLAKAWKEMGHRYLAASLGLTILLLALLSWRQQQCRLAVVSAALGLLVLVGLQAALGMWAVKVHLMPIVVTGHLLLGMMTFWLLFWLSLRTNTTGYHSISRWNGLTAFARFAMAVLFVEIVLGAWVSANYAALACSGFPQCNGAWWPKADYQTALNLLGGLSTGYTGVIAFDAQVAANWLHRVGALVGFVVLTGLMLAATSGHQPKAVRKAGLWLGALLLLQIGSAIIGVKLGAPLWAAVAHNAFAALLMLPLVAISFYSRQAYVETLPVEIEAEAVSIAPEVVEPESVYARLKSQLKRTRSGLSGVLAQIPIGQKEIGEDLLEAIEAQLLMADIGVDATTQIIKRLTDSVERHQLNDGEALTAALKQELLSMLLPCNQNLQIPKQDKPFVILVVGVNGAGKTTTIGKLAKRLQTQGHSVMLAAGDTFRAAAVEQLQTWGERNNIHVVAQHTGADSASVIYDGVQSAQAKGIDVLIADTAGRLQTKSNLMDELKKVKRIMGKLDETAPHEVLLVLDAGTGQNALSQAKLFNETVALTGLALTKLDGTAKGGVIFALAKQFGIPIRFIGIGEGIDDLQDFDAEAFVNALFVKD
ncbi:MAG: signal recognition particle-docking protein FtsY [Methylobacter sp.]|nr:signal recognition particle-docking protein FtsY [Methylobacter sp.]MDP2427521.1 signal recognition particle-docking protein FtsY [Methylobacter sp.]MDP3056806.1 signal recognition particle-docking protein FtsY [Methylobacter sp.]MDP3364025.1 signal recognition particle-docking protein FtsY [Methylobacter sp.]MDZ4220888.1 signal recognition particle-docking protein FtsY [Methylobacter sp.]